MRVEKKMVELKIKMRVDERDGGKRDLKIGMKDNVSIMDDMKLKVRKRKSIVIEDEESEEEWRRKILKKRREK